MIPEVLLSTSDMKDASSMEIVPDVLRSIREHLGMDVAFVSEFIDSQRKFRFVDAAGPESPIRAGASGPLAESYCQRVVDGRLPELIHDASQIPEALELPVTRELPVGAHLSVPIRLSGGQIYGTFCCFSTRPDFTLDERDLAMMRVFADFTAKRIERQLALDRVRVEMTDRITSVLESGAFSTVYQPIFNIRQDRLIGFESLTRFSSEPMRSPDIWFGEAAEAGLGEELEMAAIAKALAGLDQLPEEFYVALNVSPEHILSGAVARVLDDAPLNRVVLEVTEHVAIGDYSRFHENLAPLRQHGLLFAVDDAGAGYASFRHVLQLSPDLIKLDISLTRNIDTDRTRRALAAALIGFAEETGIRVVAEGVETKSELAVLRELRVNKAQGYFLSRPLPLAEAVALANVQGSTSL